MDWPSNGEVVWLNPEHFLRIYTVRRDRLRDMGAVVDGLNDALRAVEEHPEEVRITVVDGGEQNVAFFGSRTEIFGTLVVPRRTD